MAMTGILLMMVENELYYANHQEKDTAISFVIKLAITLTTVVLLAAICLYYQVRPTPWLLPGRAYTVGVYHAHCGFYQVGPTLWLHCRYIPYRL